jgi:hypothetical protein
MQESTEAVALAFEAELQDSARALLDCDHIAMGMIRQSAIANRSFIDAANRAAFLDASVR